MDHFLFVENIRLDNLKAGKTLVEEPIFWVSILLPILSSITFCVFIAKYNSLVLSFDLDGLNTFLDYMKIPIGIASLSFPFSAIVIANHRSKLTVTQINELQSTNRVSNYYKHREEFYRLCEECGSLWEVKFIVSDIDFLYTTIFPDVNPSNFSIDQVTGPKQDEFFTSIYQSINETYKCIENKWAESSGKKIPKLETNDQEVLKYTCLMLDQLYCILHMGVANKYPLAKEIYGEIYSEYWIFIPEGNPYDAFSSINNFVIKLANFSMVKDINIQIVDLPDGSWDKISKLRNESVETNKSDTA
jgi:hypothetical protein